MMPTQTPPRPEKLPRSFLSAALRPLHLAYLFTESNLFTFVVPNTVFGLLAAQSPALTSAPQSILVALSRLPHAFLFNWTNLFVFDLANQRLPESITEDCINKPWRPLPTAQITPDQARRAMLACIPATLAVSHFALAAGRESCLILILTWLYNDLKGGDEIFRDLLIALAFGLYNHASLVIIVGGSQAVTERGHSWIATISAVILTTMQVQDLKDQRGDRTRGRRTIPLVFGERVSRVSIACLVPAWAAYCAWVWDLRALGIGVVLGLAGVVAWRVLHYTSPRADAVTWKMWCLWTCVLYALPLVHTWSR